MLRIAALVIHLGTASLIALGGCRPQAVTPAPEGEYTVVNGWPVLPEGRILGQVTGIGVDSRGNVWAFHRAGREWSEPFPPDPIDLPTIAIFDGITGRMLNEWGEGLFIMPHGLTIDQHDNVWVTDVALHQVFKFSADRKLLLTLGERGVPGSDHAHFNLPTDVAVSPDGSFYVSDGYENTRVVKYADTGEYLFEWGTRGSGAGEFDLPHGIALDSNGRVFVADRSNARVQIFDANGRFLHEWKSSTIGRPYAIAISPDGSALIVDGGDQPLTPPDRSGAVHLDSTGRLLSRFGRFGNYNGQFRLAHDVAVDSKGAVYIADAWGQRVQKFVRR